MRDVIEVHELVKRYGSMTAVDGVSFSVAEGEVVGMLGPNGAGKTTTIEVLEGIRAPTGGQVRVLGHDPARGGRHLKTQVGVVLQSAGIDGALTVAETIALYAGFYRHRRPVAEALAEVDLEECAGRRVAALSGGQRRRVDLALALAARPRVLFLDEPTTGLDPAARRRTWDVIAGLRGQGVAVLLTSHYLEEVQRLADRVVVMHLGRLVAEGPPDRLGGGSELASRITFRRTFTDELPPGPWERLAAAGTTVVLATEDATEAMHALTSWAVDRGVELEGLELRRPSLEDRYLELTEGGHDR